MSNKIILITGASSGIGKASAKKLAKDGHSIVVTARSEDKLASLIEELDGGNHLYVAADASDHKAVSKVVDKAIEKFGRLDAVFANAGMGVSNAGVENGDIDEWHDMLNVNINALLYTAKLSLPQLKKTQGHFITTSSVAGRRPLKGSIYGASKYFAYGFSMNLGEEMAEWGGRCTTICPGMVNTAFFDEPKPDKLAPEDVADAVAFAINANQRSNVREIFLMPTN